MSGACRPLQATLGFFWACQKLEWKDLIEVIRYYYVAGVIRGSLILIEHLQFHGVWVWEFHKGESVFR